MACFTVAYVPNYVNSYSGETAGNAVLAGMAACAATEIWSGAKGDNRTTPTRSEVKASSDEECFEQCDDRYPPREHDKFLECMEVCK